MTRHSMLWLLAGLWLAHFSASTAAAQIKVLPGSADRGKDFIQARCTSCHSLSGTGGNQGPDLGKAPPHAPTPELLAAQMWNHAPTMLMGRSSPSISSRKTTSSDAADMFSYLYSVLYFSGPLDANRGKRVFEAKGCAGCHKDIPTTGAGGRPLSSWARVNDPIVWAERMWNHASEMKSVALQKGRALPTLTGQDVTDLLAYIRSRYASSESMSFHMGEPEFGQSSFERSCESCHSFGSAPGEKIDLLARAVPHTVSGYMAAMWNHAPLMQTRGKSPLPQLRIGEMSDLVAFLFSQAYFSQPGNPARGHSAFERKGCAGCHEPRGRQAIGPDLTKATELYSPITMTAALWSHGPEMLSALKREAKPWPQFQNSEMSDLIAYLNSKVIVRMAPLRK